MPLPDPTSGMPDPTSGMPGSGPTGREHVSTSCDGLLTVRPSSIVMISWLVHVHTLYFACSLGI